MSRKKVKETAAALLAEPIPQVDPAPADNAAPVVSDPAPQVNAAPADEAPAPPVVSDPAPQVEATTASEPAPVVEAPAAPPVVATDATDATAVPVPPEKVNAAPTCTLADVNATKERFVSLVARAAELNYELGDVANLYVNQFLGAAPGTMRRTTAVEALAREWRDWDEESLTMRERDSMRRMTERVNTLLAVQAVATIFGNGADVPKGDGTAKGRGKGKAGSPVPWGKLRELRPLVERRDDEFCEVWAPISEALREKGKELVRQIAACGLPRADVVAKVKELVIGHVAGKLADAQRVAEQQPDNKQAQTRVRELQRELEKHAPKPEEPEEPEETTEGNPPAPPATEPPAPPQQPDAPRAPEFSAMVKATTPKQAAQLIREVIEQTDAPDDLATELLGELSRSAELSKGTRAALQSAYEALTAKAKKAA